MTRILGRASRLAVLALFAAGAIGFSSSQLAAEEECGQYGTSVIFADSPAQAARQATREEKLVCVLHVSGVFEESDFT